MQGIAVHQIAETPELRIPVETLTPISFHVTRETAHWNPATRIAFRFVFAYFAFYWLSIFSGPLLGGMVSWTARHVLRLGDGVKYAMNGSGDSTYEYVLALCFLVLSAAATLIWSMLDRKRANYDRLQLWFRLVLRVGLGAFLILYGGVKVIQAQMPPPALSTLTETYGQSSPMHLLWTFIGASRGYSAFAGGAEMLSGLLLFVPAFTTIGALLAIGVMSNVFMLNMCYDVPVKLFSFHLLLMALVLAAPDVRSLADLFLFQRRAELRPSTPTMFRRKWLNRSLVGLQIAICLTVTGGSLYAAHEAAKYQSEVVTPALYGVWSVEDYTVDGKDVPPSATAEARWQRVIFDNTWRLTVETAGARQRFHLKLDDKKPEFSLSKSTDEKWKAAFTYQNQRPDVLTLAGQMDGRRINIRLRQLDKGKSFPLTSRGFHWMNEYPFNQ